MGTATKRIARRAEAREGLDRIFKQPDLVRIIHYSCESFYDRLEATSPRITSVAVRNLGSAQTVSFSIHLVAERQGIAFDKIVVNYDKLEKAMLDDFYSYVKQNSNSKWLHWNMRDINYGFLALEHRYRVLKGSPIVIPGVQLFDMAACLVDIYGPSYIPNPRMQRIMEFNQISSRHFLSGAEEANAFTKGDYVKLHQSTLKKVDIISHLAERQWNGTLRTKAGRVEQYGNSVVGLVELVTDHWLYKVAGFVGIVASVAGILLALHH